MCAPALLAAATPSATVTVRTGRPTHEISPLIKACHSDSGYAHQVRGFYSQLAVDESFEADDYPGGLWSHWVEPPAVVGNVSRDTTEAFHGVASTKLQLVSGAGRVGVSNKGLGNAGLFLEANKPYEGYLFAKPGPGAPAIGMQLTISLEGAAGRGAPLAAMIVTLRQPGWQRLNFSLTPSAATQCDTIQPADDPTVDCGKPISSVGHACVQCHGQLSVSIGTVGAVFVDYVFLQPGSWGRLGGLPVLRPAADALKAMGITAIRQGGSYASRAAGSASYYQWQVRLSLSTTPYSAPSQNTHARARTHTHNHQALTLSHLASVRGSVAVTCTSRRIVRFYYYGRSGPFHRCIRYIRYIRYALWQEWTGPPLHALHTLHTLRLVAGVDRATLGAAVARRAVESEPHRRLGTLRDDRHVQFARH